jgi:integrase
LSLGEVGLQDKPMPEAMTVDKLLDHLQSDYETRGKWYHQNQSLFKAVREGFGKRNAETITTPEIEGYVKQMKKQEYSESTIAHRLQVLAQAYEHARKIGVCNFAAPAIPDLPNKDINIRQGFFNREGIEQVIEYLPEHLRDFTRMGFFIGWRKGALAGLKWTDVDLTAGEERMMLPGILSKNRKPVWVPIEAAVAEIIKRQMSKRTVGTKAGATVLSSYIFHREDGKKIGDIRWVWNEACSRAGLGMMVCNKCASESSTNIWCTTCHQRRDYEGRYFHDLRRSAVRRLVQNGVPRKVAMSITGHKTEHIFERYNIVEDSQQREAIRKISEPWKSKVTKIG